MSLKAANLELTRSAELASLAATVSDPVMRDVLTGVSARFDPTDTSEEALIHAVARCWKSDSSGRACSTPKQVHESLSYEGQWRGHVTLPDVKKAWSKARKRGLISEAAASPPAAADPLTDDASKRLGSLGKMDNCTEFANALFTRLTGSKEKLRRRASGGSFLKGGRPIGADGLFAVLQAAKPKAGQRGVCFLSLSQIGHDLILETAVDANGELRARPFSAWVYQGPQRGDANNDGMKALERDARRLQKKSGAKGFMAADWVGAGRARWWSETELKEFSERLRKLRALVDALVADYLTKAMYGAAQQLSLAERRHWVSELCMNVETDPLMQQPASLVDDEHVKAYKKSQIDFGIPEEQCSAVVYRLPNGDGQRAQQVLDFPLTAGAPIVDAICELFGEHPSPFVWLKMVEFEGLAEGWECAIGEAK